MFRLGRALDFVRENSKRAIAGDEQQQVAQLRLCFVAQGGANVRFAVAHYQLGLGGCMKTCGPMTVNTVPPQRSGDKHSRRIVACDTFAGEIVKTPERNSREM